VSSRYIGEEMSVSIIKRYWQHAWVNSNFGHTPNVVATESIENKGNIILVSKIDEENYLKNLGYRSKAIGLPYCYVSNVNEKRIENSLLVMPAHCTKDLSIELSDEYKIFINKVKSQRVFFKKIVICLHYEDFRKNNHDKWVKHGFEVVVGARTDDSNALVRMKTLFQQFSTILTDAVGSHVVYAASSGARISIQSPIGWKYDLSKLEQFELDGGSFSTENWPIEFYFLFCDPIDASTHIEWGLEQIGYNNKLSPDDLKKILGWNFPDKYIELFIYYSNKVMNKIKRLLRL
jgi:hypothetical protein